jgi:hypothetical protein
MLIKNKFNLSIIYLYLRYGSLYFLYCFLENMLKRSYSDLFMASVYWHEFWIWFFDERLQVYHDENIRRAMDECFNAFRNGSYDVDRDNGSGEYYINQCIHESRAEYAIDAIYYDLKLLLRVSFARPPRILWVRVQYYAKAYFAMCRNLVEDVRTQRFLIREFNNIMGFLWARIIRQQKCLVFWRNTLDSRLSELFVPEKYVTRDMIRASIVSDLMENPYGRAGFFSFDVSFEMRHGRDPFPNDEEYMFLKFYGRRICFFDNHSEDFQAMIKLREKFHFANIRNMYLGLFFTKLARIVYGGLDRDTIEDLCRKTLSFC